MSTKFASFGEANPGNEGVVTKSLVRVRVEIAHYRRFQWNTNQTRFITVFPHCGLSKTGC